MVEAERLAFGVEVAVQDVRLDHQAGGPAEVDCGCFDLSVVLGVDELVHPEDAERVHAVDGDATADVEANTLGDARGKRTTLQVLGHDGVQIGFDPEVVLEGQHEDQEHGHVLLEHHLDVVQVSRALGEDLVNQVSTRFGSDHVDAAVVDLVLTPLAAVRELMRDRSREPVCDLLCPVLLTTLVGGDLDGAILESARSRGRVLVVRGANDQLDLGRVPDRGQDATVHEVFAEQVHGFAAEVFDLRTVSGGRMWGRIGSVDQLIDASDFVHKGLDHAIEVREEGVGIVGDTQALQPGAGVPGAIGGSVRRLVRLLLEQGVDAVLLARDIMNLRVTQDGAPDPEPEICQRVVRGAAAVVHPEVEELGLRSFADDLEKLREEGFLFVFAQPADRRGA